jgi:peptide-methionine (R)-S-oxide reductase
MEKVKKSEAEWRAQLAPMEYAVTLEGDRAPTPVLDHYDKGSSPRCRTALASDTKFDSGCGR